MLTCSYSSTLVLIISLTQKTLKTLLLTITNSSSHQSSFDEAQKSSPKVLYITATDAWCKSLMHSFKDMLQVCLLTIPGFRFCIGWSPTNHGLLGINYCHLFDQNSRPWAATLDHHGSRRSHLLSKSHSSNKQKKGPPMPKGSDRASWGSSWVFSIGWCDTLLFKHQSSNKHKKRVQPW